MKKVINKELYYTHLLTSLGKLQQLGEIGRCPRCGYRPMSPNLILNAMSRHADVYICPSCGMEEAQMAAAHKEPLPFSKWALFRGCEEDHAPVRDTFISAEPEIRSRRQIKEIYALGLALNQDCPSNDCIIFRNLFNMARELDGAIEVVDGYPAMVMRGKLRENILELKRMWEENYAILAYRAQHGTEGETPRPWYPGTKEKSGYAAEALTGRDRV